MRDEKEERKKQARSCTCTCMYIHLHVHVCTYVSLCTGTIFFAVVNLRLACVNNKVLYQLFMGLFFVK